MPESKETVGATGFPGIKTAAFLFLLLVILLAGLSAQEEGEEEDVFKGVGIHVRLGGGYSLLSAGDLDKGLQGMYDWGAQSVVSAGYTLGKSDWHSPRAGYEFGGDIVYYFAGRLGIGAGGSMVRVNKTNKQLFTQGTDPWDWAMTTGPQIDIVSFRLGLFYALPFGRLLTVCFNAGPAYYSTHYRYSGNIQRRNYAYAISQDAKAKTWGIHGGLGLEIRMNERMAFILEVQGRYAKVSGFEGKEQLYEQSAGGLTQSSEKNGLLYYLEREGYPRLEVLAEAPIEGYSSREAAFDLSGISFRGGLTFKF